MSNIVTERQLQTARILAGLPQKQLAQAVGVHERAARYRVFFDHTLDRMP